MLRISAVWKNCWFVLFLAALGAADAKSAPVAGDFQISGILVDANTGQPIPRARVAIAPVTERDNFTTVITHEDGRFLFPNLTSGKYTLTAQARGYLLQSFNQHDAFASSIVVGSDIDSTNLVFRLPPEGSVSGVIADEAGEPVRGAQVRLYSTGVSAGAQATRPRGAIITDDEGFYHFGHLPPGRYLVAVIAKPWYAQNQRVLHVNSSGDSAILGEPAVSALDVAYPVTFAPGVTDASAASPIVLVRGEKAIADVRLQPVPAVRLHVPREASDPEGSTRVTLQKQVLDGPSIQMNPLYSTTQQNEMEVSGVPPGRYTMNVATVGASGSNTSPTREVDISGNGTIDDRQGGSSVPVSARIQFDAAAPRGQISLQFLNKKSRQPITERISDDGEVTFKQGLLPGSYEVSIFSNSELFIKSISATGANVAGRTVDIRAGSNVRLEIVAALGQGQVTGTALRQGKPLAGAMIVLVPADPGHNTVLFRRDQSDSDGTFTLANVVPGSYTLLAIENGWDLEWMKPSVLRPYMSAGAPVQVQANGKYDAKIPVQ